MNTLSNPPHLRFDFPFPNASAATEPHVSVCFSQPEQIVVAHSIDEVLPALHAVEEAARQGKYAAGFLAYEAAPAFDPAMTVHPLDSASEFPLLWLGIFSCPEAQADVETAQANEAALEDEYQAAHLQEITVLDWQPSVTQAEHGTAIAKIRDWIADGETYQVNYTMRLRAQATADEQLYDRLRRAQQGQYSAYLDLGHYKIVSVSPELFFHRVGDKITTRPMKGTILRGRWTEEDDRQAQALATSAKDRAENIMIVDLLRNDLGRIARSGTVRVTDLFALERYPTVWQMTSTIEAELAPQTSLTDIFRALFPCGSVTGAPKIQTMRHIARLENAPRNVYCGAIGLIAPTGEAMFNVAIRTLVADTHTHTAEYGVGGGITWDSTAQGEYAEMLAKSAILTDHTPSFELLETLRLENGTYWLLGRHLDRVCRSAHYFGYAAPRNAIEAALEVVAQQHREGTWRVRCLVSAAGGVRTEAFPLAPANDDAPLTVALAVRPIDASSPYLFHKTTYRALYETYRRETEQALERKLDEVLLWNENGELTEFLTGNLLIEHRGRLWTPPLACGLLPGTLRAELLANGNIHERVLTPADLNKASGAWFLNSVRGRRTTRLLLPD